MDDNSSLHPHTKKHVQFLPKTDIMCLEILSILKGGGKFTLSALYRLKSPESRHKIGVMGYQNSSWDICDLTKKVSGPKKF